MSQLSFLVNTDASNKDVPYVSPLNITTQTTTLVKTGAGALHILTFNKPVATGTVAIYDGLTAAGILLATITVPASPQPVSLFYDITFSTGLTIVTGVANQDITVSYI